MKHTPGPWVWSRVGGELMLHTPDRGMLVVMDFVRKDMYGAQPRFATWQGEERGRLGGALKGADALNPVIHPDARLIAAAPDLLAALKLVQLAAISSSTEERFGEAVTAAMEHINAAVAKAEGTVKV